MEDISSLSFERRMLAEVKKMMGGAASKVRTFFIFQYS